MKKKIPACIVFCIVCLLLVSAYSPEAKMLPPVTVTAAIPPSENATIDVSYIYNITAALSNIVFTSYGPGEIAKGRAYGTKGEQKAAEILYENMSLLGLNPVLEQLEDRRGMPDLVTVLEVQNYTMSLNGQILDCFVSPSWKGPRVSPDELNNTVSYSGLTVKPMPSHPELYNKTIAADTSDFMFLSRDQWNDPNGTLPVIDLLKPFLNPLKFYMLFHITSLFNIKRETAAWYRMYPHCKGLLLSDFNQECHDCIFLPKNGNSIPVIFITGNDGNKIRDDYAGSTIDFTMTQHLNTSVISSNVIGELKGVQENKVFILSCLYDGWWNQATADSAIGMAMVLGVAKYFVDAGITPQYTIKFIGFSGEEYDMLGAKYYESVHKTENIVGIIDLNQLGFTQESPPLSLDFVANKASFLKSVWDIVQRTDYMERTGNVTNLKAIWWPSGWIPGNADAFATKRPLIPAMSIFKDGGWILHHRDGNNHTAGDVLSYFNWTDTLVTAEIVCNITLAFTVGNTDARLFGRSSPSVQQPFLLGSQEKLRQGCLS